jgi:hypothetical protein
MTGFTDKAEDAAISERPGHDDRVRAGDGDTLSGDEMKALPAAKTPLAFWPKNAALPRSRWPRKPALRKASFQRSRRERNPVMVHHFAGSQARCG